MVTPNIVFNRPDEVVNTIKTRPIRNGPPNAVFIIVIWRQFDQCRLSLTTNAKFRGGALFYKARQYNLNGRQGATEEQAMTRAALHLVH